MTCDSLNANGFVLSPIYVTCDSIYGNDCVHHKFSTEFL